MKSIFRISQSLLETVRKDLLRPHPFAAERVGFLVCRFGWAPKGDLLILTASYIAVGEQDYVDNPRFGALLGPSGFSRIFGFAFQNDVGIFHIHVHHHRGRPGFSGIDRAEMAKYVPDFFNVRQRRPHGAIVASLDRLAGCIWMTPRSKGKPISEFQVIGSPGQLFKEEQ
jgi:hypothetical protein